MTAASKPELLGPQYAGPAPFFSAKALPVAMVGGLLLCWPMAIGGAFYSFADSSSYFRGGEKIWSTFLDLLGTIFTIGGQETGEAASGNLLIVNEKGSSVTGRSFTYSVYAHLLYTSVGVWGFAIAQAFLAVLAAFALVTRSSLQSPGVMAAGAVVMIALTTLPWHAIYLMPDVFGATLLIFGIVLMRDFDDFTRTQKVGLTLLTAAAASTHYGNVPLIFGIVLWVFIIRLFQRRMTRAVLVAGVVAAGFAPVANISGSTAVLDTLSVTPKRMPIALSRSLSDGPALWYLQDACPEADYAICEAFGDDLRGNTHWFLWSDTGLKSLDPEMVDRIRDEEFTILGRAFMAYPLQQSASLLRNSVRQIFRIGTGQVWPAYEMGDGIKPIYLKKDEWPLRLVQAFDPITVWTTGTGVAVLLVALVLGQLGRRRTEQVFILAIGLAGNAFIFGGLSSPVERYQSRIAWVIPLLAIVVVAELMAERRKRVG